ncbi:golgin subfamily A member 6-like protein 2 [Palaemon carinicauda]|uniref:golgin subfamily A member 6-like protein 2 n=1 Tax=Palaemon carinicauda TaxID=392227 RepID=UPI0035B571B0
MLLESRDEKYYWRAEKRLEMLFESREEKTRNGGVQRRREMLLESREMLLERREEKTRNAVGEQRRKDEKCCWSAEKKRPEMLLESREEKTRNAVGAQRRKDEKWRSAEKTRNAVGEQRNAVGAQRRKEEKCCWSAEKRRLEMLLESREEKTRNAV